MKTKFVISFLLIGIVVMSGCINERKIVKLTEDDIQILSVDYSVDLEEGYGWNWDKYWKYQCDLCRYGTAEHPILGGKTTPSCDNPPCEHECTFTTIRYRININVPEGYGYGLGCYAVIDGVPDTHINPFTKNETIFRLVMDNSGIHTLNTNNGADIRYDHKIDVCCSGHPVQSANQICKTITLESRCD